MMDFHNRFLARAYFLFHKAEGKERKLPQVKGRETERTRKIKGGGMEKTEAGREPKQLAQATL